MEGHPLIEADSNHFDLKPSFKCNIINLKHTKAMKYLDVVSKRQFAVDGELKTDWNKVGVVRITKKGNMYLNLYHLPTTDFHVFETKLDSDVDHQKDC